MAEQQGTGKHRRRRHLTPAEKYQVWCEVVSGQGTQGVFSYSASGLLAPPWAVVTVAVVWVGLLAAAVHLRKNRPWLVAATPIASLAFWFAFMTFGDLALGWTA